MHDDSWASSNERPTYAIISRVSSVILINEFFYRESKWLVDSELRRNVLIHLEKNDADDNYEVIGHTCLNNDLYLVQNCNWTNFYYHYYYAANCSVVCLRQNDAALLHWLEQTELAPSIWRNSLSVCLYVCLCVYASICVSACLCKTMWHQMYFYGFLSHCLSCLSFSLSRQSHCWLDFTLT